jgi:uncharacterized membrane protein YfbV (UPF0208 family)
MAETVLGKNRCFFWRKYETKNAKFLIIKQEAGLNVLNIELHTTKQKAITKRQNPLKCWFRNLYHKISKETKTEYIVIFETEGIQNFSRILEEKR